MCGCRYVFVSACARVVHKCVVISADADVILIIGIRIDVDSDYGK